MIDYDDFRAIVSETLFREEPWPFVSLPYVVSEETGDIPIRNVIGVKETLNLARLEDLADYLSVDSRKIEIDFRRFTGSTSLRNLWYVAWRNALVLDDFNPPGPAVTNIMQDGFFVLSFPPLIRLAEEVPSMIQDW